MAGANYVLDKTFRAYGSIGTYLAVAANVGTTGFVRIHQGTVGNSTVTPIGVTQSGVSASGVELVVRMYGLTKAQWQAAQGTVPLGRPVYCSTRAGKFTVVTPKALVSGIGTLRWASGICTSAEGKGSANSFFDLMLNPMPVYI